MSDAAEPYIQHVFVVGEWSVRIIIPERPGPGKVIVSTCEWDPEMPSRPFTADELNQYKAGVEYALELATGSIH